MGNILKMPMTKCLPGPSRHHGKQPKDTCSSSNRTVPRSSTNDISVSLSLPRQILITHGLHDQYLSRQGIAHSRAISDHCPWAVLEAPMISVHHILMAALNIYPYP